MIDLVDDLQIHVGRGVGGLFDQIQTGMQDEIVLSNDRVRVALGLEFCLIQRFVATDYDE